MNQESPALIAMGVRSVAGRDSFRVLSVAELDANGLAFGRAIGALLGLPLPLDVCDPDVVLTLWGHDASAVRLMRASDASHMLHGMGLVALAAAVDSPRLSPSSAWCVFFVPDDDSDFKAFVSSVKVRRTILSPGGSA